MQYFNYPGKSNEAPVAEFKVFDSFTDEDWKILVNYAQTLHFTVGETLLLAGETDNGVFILVNGCVEVLMQTEFGRQKVIAEINEGSLFGELSFFDEQPRSAAVRATTKGEALHLTHAGFDRLAVANPALARRLLFDMGRILAYRFRRASSSVI